MKLIGANASAAVTGAEELPGKSNYFLGNDPKKWRTNVPTYAKVKYQNVYPGVDLVYYGNQGGQLEYDFVVAPGADLSAIVLDVGAVREPPTVAAVSDRWSAVGISPLQKRASRPVGTPLQIAPDGDIVIKTDGGEVRFRKPMVYQDAESEVRGPESGVQDPIRNSKFENHRSAIDNRQLLEGHFTLDARNRVHFAVGPYDHNKPLIIDPVLALTVSYSTFIPFPIAPGSGGIAADSSGDVYLVGTTNSSTLPVVNPLPSPNNALHGTSNLFVAKMNSTGTALVYSTYLGGSGTDSAGYIALDSNGDVYVTGATTSADFPTTTSAYQTALPGTRSGFVTQLNASGNAIVYSTYLGGSGTDGGVGIATSGPGIVYVTGSASSNNFPTTSGVYQTTLKGNQNAFVAEINTTQTGSSSLVYATYLGGSGYDSGGGIGVDSSGDVTVAGTTSSSNFPTLNAYQGGRGLGTITVFVTKLNSTGTALVYSTYLGGNYFNGPPTQYAYNEFGGLAVDSAGNAYVGGYTDAYDFPTHLPYQSFFPGACTWDGFVAKFNPAGSNVYSTYFGGTGYQGTGVNSCAEISGVASDSAGNVYFTGFTEADNLPLMNPVQSVQGGGLAETFAISAFISELSAGGASAPTLRFSTYLGGTYEEEGYAAALDNSANIYVAGLSYSSDFPVIAGGYQTTPGQGYNFLAKISSLATPAMAVTPETVTFAAQAMGNKTSARTVLVHDLSGNALTISNISLGGTNAADFAATNTCTSAVSGGTDCSISATFTPSMIGPESATLTVTSNGATGNPTTITLNGTGASDGVATLAPSNTLSFGYQLLDTNSQQTVKLTNTGTGALGSISISLSPGPPDFTQTNNCPTSLAVNASCNIIVTYKANILGYDSGTLTITDDAPTSPQTLSVYGYGAVPVAQVSSSSWNFGSWAVGTTSSAQNFFLTNNGGIPLTINGIAFVGPNANDFKITANTCDSSVAGYNNCGLTIAFVPSVYGPESATLTLTDNSNNLAGSTQTVILTGTGVHVAQLSATSVNFGNQTVNTTSGPRAETLTNFGATPLTITNIAASAPFTQTNTCGTSLAANTSCKIVITFKPTALGSQGGAVTLVDNAPSSSPPITLAGNGISAPLTSCPTSFLHASTNYGHLPLSFEANAGQTDPQVKFLSRGRGYGLFLTGDEAVLELQKAGGGKQKAEENRPWALVPAPVADGRDPGRDTKDQGQMTKDVLRMKLLGANPAAKATGLEELGGKSNYFVGNDPSKWVKHAPTYAKVRYKQVYPGIDLVYYGNQRGQLEYDFVVAPGADPSAIALDVGAGLAPAPVRPQGSPLRIASNGDLVIPTDGGQVVFHKPVVYQEPSVVQSPDSGVQGETRNSGNRQSTIVDRHFLDGRFALSADNRIGFEVGPYDHTKPLVIDPDLNYATYLGGSGGDLAVGIAVDSSCSAYISGQTTSIDFPLSPNAPQTAYGGGSKNGFVTKLSPDGTAIVYSTYLGGNTDDEGRLIAVDPSGNAYVTGRTQSSNFPISSNAFQNSFAGPLNAFLTELSPDGSTLLYSTYFGVYREEAFGIAVDSSGNAYIAGRSANCSNCDISPPTTSGAFERNWAGAENAFVAKFNTTASGSASLVYATLLGGSGDDRAFGIAIDSSGNAYVTGSTTSANFPTLNAYQSTFGGGGTACGSGTKAAVCGDAFVTELNNTGTALLYSTYLGGSGEDGGVGIALDPSGKTYVSGGTDSSNFPTSAGAFQTAFNSSTSGCTNAGVACGNAFVAKLDTTQSGAASLLYSTYLGGENDDLAAGIVADASGFASVAGVTNSTLFPTVNPMYPFGGGTIPCLTSDLACGDAFVTKLNPTGSGLTFSTYLGGSQDDGAFSLALDSLGNAYIAGATNSSNLPTTPGAFQKTYGGGTSNAFAARIGYIEFPIATLTSTSLTFAAQNFGTTSSPQTVTLTNNGDTPLAINNITFGLGTQGFAQTNNCPVSPSTLAVGANCQFKVTYSPTQSGSQSDILFIYDNEPTGQSSINLSGTGNGGQTNFSTTSLNFTSQAVNTTSTSQPVTISNGGNVALTVSSITITGSNSGDFGQTNTCNSGIPESGNCTINVTFTPTAAGTRNATMSVTYNNGAASSTQTVSLTGTGLAPPAISKVFGAASIPLNGTTSLTLTISNPAANTVGLSGVGFTDSLPAGLVVATPNGLSATCAGASISATAGSGVVSLTGYSLVTGASCTLAVNVTGTTAGALNNSVTVTSTNGGTGNTASASLTVFTALSITKSFGATTIGVSGVTSLIFLINNPNANFTVNGIAFTDNLPAGLAVATPNGLSGTCGGGTITAAAGSSAITLAGATLAPSTSCTFSVNVVGTSVTNGAVTNSVIVTSTNAGTGNTSNASVTVVGAAGVVSPTGLAFGNQDVSIPSAPQPVMLQNVSSSTLSITSISVVGANPGDFPLGGTCGATLAAQATCQINVTFDPVATGNRSATLQVVYNAAGSPQTVSLSGTGVAPNAQVSVSSLSFQHNVNLACPPKPVIIQNNGTGPLLIQSITTSGVFTQTNTCGTSLAAGSSCEIDVTFVPNAINTFSGALTIVDNDPTSPQVVTLSGQGLPPCALSSPFTTTQVLRSTPSVNFTIADNAPSCHTSTISMACANNGPATCVFSPATMAPGGSTALSVQNLSSLPSDTFSFTVTGTDPTVTTSVGLLVLLSDFTFTPYPTTATVTAGQTANYAMTLTPVNGLAGTIQLACQGAPANSACTVTPATVSLVNNYPAQISVAVTTAGRALGAPRGGAPLPWPGEPRTWNKGQRYGLWLWAALVALMGLAGGAAAGRRHAGALRPSLAYRRLRLSGLALAALVLLLLAWAACGGGGGAVNLVSNPRTPAGTYSLTVTGTYDSSSGQPTGLTRSQSLTLQVN